MLQGTDINDSCNSENEKLWPHIALWKQIMFCYVKNKLSLRSRLTELFAKYFK